MDQPQETDMTDEKPGYTPEDTGDPSVQFVLPPKPQPGEAPPPYYPPVGQAVIIRNGRIQPDDYMGFAICMTICCCLMTQPFVVPCGIFSIVKASEVRSRFRLGDYQGAEQASQAAKKWATIAMVVGLTVQAIFVFLYVILYVAFVPR